MQWLDYYFLKIKLVFFFIYYCQHHERKTICLDLFVLLEGVPNTIIYSAVFLESPYYNYL